MDDGRTTAGRRLDDGPKSRTTKGLRRGRLVLGHAHRLPLARSACQRLVSVVLVVHVVHSVVL